MRKNSTIKLLIMITILFLLTPIIQAQETTTTFEAYTKSRPTIDGTITSSEWKDADKSEITLTWQGETHPATLYVMNDYENLYVAATIENEDLDDDDLFEIIFDNDNDGQYDDGDDRLIQGFPTPMWGWGTFYRDCYFYDNGDSTWDTNAGGTNDGQGVFTHTYMGTYDVDGTYIFELSHPLNSDDDLHDFSLKTGDTVGFYVRFQDDLEYTDSWPGDTYAEMAKIKIASPWKTSPRITIHPKQGQIGEIVTIRGTHFTPIKDTKVTLYLYTVSGTQIMEIDEFKTDKNGRFRDTFMIPARHADTYLLKAIDNELGLTATTILTITPPESPEITIHPEQGQIGEIVTIRGTHFTPIKDTKVTLYLYTVSGTELMEIDEFKTDKNGRFRDTFMIPARPADTYLLKAIDNESGLTATTILTIIS